MDYEEARKQVNAVKPKDNYVIFEMSYDRKMLLPQKAGLLLMEALTNMERLQDGYTDLPRIVPVDKGDFVLRPFSNEEYTQYKMAGLLGLDKLQFDALQQEMKKK